MRDKLLESIPAFSVVQLRADYSEEDGIIELKDCVNLVAPAYPDYFYHYFSSYQRNLMSTISFGLEYMKEIETEVRASRRCLEAIPDKLYEWKPHEKSMNMGYLALLVADIPRWITDSIERSEIDFTTYQQFPLSTTEALLKHFDQNIENVKRVLAKVTNQELETPFYLKNGGKVLMTSSQKENVQSCINHWVHHRGQLTVYMRLNDIAVPSIYGPSADERTF